MTDRCPFCDPDPAAVVFRHQHVIGMWDRFPVSNGHFLLIAARHIPGWFEATAAERIAIIEAIEEARTCILHRCKPDGFNVGFNEGEAAGQTVGHLHIHVIPRYAHDVFDPRGGIRHVLPARANYLAAPPSLGLFQCSPVENYLVRGLADPFLIHLRACTDRALSVDFAVAFILRSGVALLREHLRDLLARGGKVRIVTGDYLDVTDPDALLQLLDLGDGLDLRVFEAGQTSFHPKAYIFHEPNTGGTAFVGSSNLTLPALQGGVEWNYRVLRAESDRGFRQVATAFEDLLLHPKTRKVDEGWIEAYRQRRGPVLLQRVVEVVEEPQEPPPEPHDVQREGLIALAETRRRGNEAGLVVLATGLGKTWLAAFDSVQGNFSRVLFVAHREEILTQAMQTFRRIRPKARLGRYTGEEKSPEAEILFASIQTLGRAQHLKRFSPDAFDYIVVDEFHHAAARTYRQLIEYFAPRFLLGLTATPERTDGGDLLALCQENLVYRKDLVAGIQAGLLCPFEYFGVPDDVDYSNIPWRSTRFDEEELTKAVATTGRAQNALDQFRQRAGRKALGFCCSQRHADFMTEYFVRAGVRAASVHSGASSAPRASSLEALGAGQLDIIFAVDIFNEGLDLPTIDTVLMLRPTESSIIWLQQFGRGLRVAEGKERLTVVDYIGNHRTFLMKVRSLIQPLLGTGDSDSEIAAAMRLLQQGRATLPPGCSVTYELGAIDIIRELLRTRSADDAIVAFYEDFRERHGVRPTALELFHSGYNPRSLRKTHGSWLQFVKMMGGLSSGEQDVVREVGTFLDALETTPMTKSFKFLTLLAMLNRDALPGQIAIDDLLQEFRRVAHRSAALRADVGSALDDDRQLQALVEQNPIAAWTEGRGTAGTSYFSYSQGSFRFNPPVGQGHREDFQNLVREFADWRLAEYLDRGQTTQPNQFVCKVIHADGRPILKLPNRTSTPGVPIGTVEIRANGRPYYATFAKEFLNVVREGKEEGKNLIPDIVRGWFGPDAGQPGTRYQVLFEPAGDFLEMKPGGSGRSAGGAELWKHYMREDIPPLFGYAFNQGIWNQGFVVLDSHVFLLVTLEKSGHHQDHRYEDAFVSDSKFQWQSQNRTTQASRHGQLIRNHVTNGTQVHLFVRRHKLLDGKAAPFVYCGPVTFANWSGDSPITVAWALGTPVPQSLRSSLAVPVT